MAQAANLDGESSSGGSRALGVKVCVRLPQAGRFQDVAALPVDEEAPRIEVHLIAWRLEVQGHCGHSGVRRALGGPLLTLFQGPHCPLPHTTLQVQNQLLQKAQIRAALLVPTMRW